MLNSYNMVPAARLELAQLTRRRILSPLCLPIPPRGLLACSTGFEPVTYCLEGSCSIQLSYASTIKFFNFNHPIQSIPTLLQSMQ